MLRKEAVMRIIYEKESVPRARELRKNATPQENKLWHCFLKAYPIRFQRQKPIENYIVDFYCHRAGLVIELDGSQHYEPDEQKYDAHRTEALEKHGLQVLRYSNLDIDRHFREVCEQIDDTVKQRIREKTK